MSSRILQPLPENIRRAANLLRTGKLVAFPTETVYGLGADATNDLAVKEIFRVKGRPANDPLIVHADSIEKISRLVLHGSNSTRFHKVSRLWPGPLSVILPKAESIPLSVTAGLNSVAVRIPSHPVALELLRESELSIAAPSANPFCYVSPTSAEHVEEQLGGKIEVILDGGRCKVGIESTVIDLTTNQPRILRPGVITKETLEEVLGEKISSIECADKSTAQLPSPGMLLKHYSPKTKLKFSDQVDPSTLRGSIGLIRFKEDYQDLGVEFQALHTLSSNAEPLEIARNLYQAIREQDQLGLDLILIDRCPEEGVGVAVMDRLRRATRE